MKSLIQYIKEKLIINKDLIFHKNENNIINDIRDNKNLILLIIDFSEFIGTIRLQLINNIIINSEHNDVYKLTYDSYSYGVTENYDYVNVYGNILYMYNNILSIYVNPVLNEDILTMIYNNIKQGYRWTIEDILGQMNLEDEYKFLKKKLKFEDKSYKIINTNRDIAFIQKTVEDLEKLKKQ